MANRGESVGMRLCLYKFIDEQLGSKTTFIIDLSSKTAEMQSCSELLQLQ